MNLKILLAAGCVEGKVQHVIGQNLVTESPFYHLETSNQECYVPFPRPAAPQAAAMDMAIPMKKSTKHAAKRYGKKPVKSYLRAAQ